MPRCRLLNPLMGCAHAGLLTDTEAQRLFASLSRDPIPPPDTPDVPWAVAGRTVDGRWIASCATMWSAGVFWSVHGGSPLIGLHPRDVLGEAKGPQWSLDGDWLLDFLRHAADPTGSPYTGLRRLLPGQTLTITAAGAATVTDWSTLPDRPQPTLTGAEAVGEYRAAIAEAVAAGLDRCGPVTAEVSGGLDSTFVVASLARSYGGEILGLTAVPLPNCPSSRPGWVANDLPDASLLHRAYPHVTLRPVMNRDGIPPLSAAHDAASRSWWPPFATSNQVWLDQIAAIAGGRGSKAIWTGRSGNFSFSRGGDGAWQYHLAQRDWPSAARLLMPPGGLLRPRQWASAVRRNLAAPARSRQDVLRQIHGQHCSNGAAGNPGSGGMIVLDPFRSRAVVDVASRLIPATWDNWLLPRGFAREVGRDRVPDGIRLRRTRGMQAADVWLWIHDRRDDYLDAVRSLPDAPVLGPELAEMPVMRTVSAWPWGDPQTAPSLADVTQVNRVLAMADFLRLTDARLRAVAQASSLGAG